MNNKRQCHLQKNLILNSEMLVMSWPSQLLHRESFEKVLLWDSEECRTSVELDAFFFGYTHSMQKVGARDQTPL